MSHFHTDRLAALMNEAVLVADRGWTGAGSGPLSPRTPGLSTGKQDPLSGVMAFGQASFGPGSMPQAGTGSSMQYCSTMRPQIWARLVLASCLGARS